MSYWHRAQIFVQLPRPKRISGSAVTTKHCRQERIHHVGVADEGRRLKEAWMANLFGRNHHRIRCYQGPEVCFHLQPVSIMSITHGKLDGNKNIALSKPFSCCLMICYKYQNSTTLDRKRDRLIRGTSTINSWTTSSDQRHWSTFRPRRLVKQVSFTSKLLTNRKSNTKPDPVITWIWITQALFYINIRPQYNSNGVTEYSTKL